MNTRPARRRLAAAAGLATALALVAAPRVAADVVFEPRVESLLAGPGAGDSLVGGDLDGDCILDLLSTRDESVASETLSVIVRLGDGTGGYSGGGTIGGGLRLADLLLVDVDRDGILDLLTAESFEPTPNPAGICLSDTPMVPVLLGDGTGGFTALTCLQAKDHPTALVAGDFDGDRTPDVIVVNAPSSCCGATSQDVMLFRGLGDGTFDAGTVVVQRRGLDVETADFDGDGHLDLAIAGVNDTYVYLGDGAGGFTALGNGVIGGLSKKIAVGDINGDGAPDIAAVGSEPLTSSDDVVWTAINRNDGSGGFLSPGVALTGQHPVDVALVDFDLDGYDDVVVANNLGASISVFAGSASGALGAAQSFLAGQDPMAVVAADLDLDGFPDVVVSNRNEIAGEVNDGTLSTLIQQVSAPLAVGTAALPDGEVTIPYVACLGAVGGTAPYAWQQTLGALPDGLSLSTIGRISGTPTIAGTSDFTVQVQDGGATVGERALAITVCIDADADGVLDCRGDCDDADPDRFPGNPEVCDGKDNDCDLVVDSGLDGDGDGVDDLCDNCPATSNAGQADGDADGAGDACDGCPADADKQAPGVCGCGVSDVDGDLDGTADCLDGCPADPLKIAPGACGCGLPDTDADSDGLAACDDCNDANPNCTSDCTDVDGDGYCVTTDCNDSVPAVNPGAAEVGCDGIDNDCSAATPDVLDADMDGWTCNVDCNDGNGAINPGATEVGCDGIDNDCSAATADLRDGDGDGRNCNVDCDDANAQTWSTPGVTRTLVVAEDRQTVSWVEPFSAGTASVALRYDLVRTGDPSTYLASGDCVDCVAWGEGPTPSAVDGQTPAAGRAFFYLSRAINDCPAGQGSLGTDSRFVPRVATCGLQLQDGDNDGTPDCDDGCPVDPLKIIPGVCGCGIAENLADLDVDGVVACMDCDDMNPDCRSDCTDNDEDLHCAPFDCNDGSTTAWRLPGEAGPLTMAVDRQGLSWQAPADPGGDRALLRYDVLRSDRPGDFLVSGVCVDPGGSDTAAVDATQPTVGQVLHYLVRAANGCPGAGGSLGTASNGDERLGAVCP